MGTELLHPEGTLSGLWFIKQWKFQKGGKSEANVERGICWKSAHSVFEPIRAPLPSCASMQPPFLCFRAESWRLSSEDLDLASKPWEMQRWSKSKMKVYVSHCRCPNPLSPPGLQNSFYACRHAHTHTHTHTHWQEIQVTSKGPMNDDIWEHSSEPAIHVLLTLW